MGRGGAGIGGRGWEGQSGTLMQEGRKETEEDVGLCLSYIRRNVEIIPIVPPRHIRHNTY